MSAPAIVVLEVEQLRSLIREAVRAELANVRQPEEWLDVKGAAEYLGLCREYLCKLARRGEIPASRLGRDWRFRRSELDAHMAKQGRKVG